MWSIRLTEPNGRRHLVVVEAKYLSGKSSEEDPSCKEPLDQLAREWDNLRKARQTRKRRSLLLYVTADVGMPRQEIDASAEAYASKRNDGTAKSAFDCAWLSWRKLCTVFRRGSGCADRDLCALAERMALCYFESCAQFDAKPLIEWNYACTIASPLMEGRSQVTYFESGNWFNAESLTDWSFAAGAISAVRLEYPMASPESLEVITMNGNELLLSMRQLQRFYRDVSILLKAGGRRGVHRSRLAKCCGKYGTRGPNQTHRLAGLLASILHISLF